jgi:lysophospholipase L1-like esterase
MKNKLALSVLTGFIFLGMNAFSQDTNLWIFVCFGQSNMEGFPGIQEQDKRNVDNRFQVLAAVDFPKLDRKKGNWYPAVPPLCRPSTGLCPADYFGRTMVSNLPPNIKVGIVNVSVAGCKIELFETDHFQTYVAMAPSWMTNIIKGYDGNPYQYLVETAKLAQKDGVIKGILLHQGESNTNDKEWPNKVKGIYNNLLKDLNLKAEFVPLLAGEVVNLDQQGACASMNKIIDDLPKTIPTAHVISSAGCSCRPDHLHFTPEGYRELGTRYAQTMLPLLGYKQANLFTADSHWVATWGCALQLTEPNNLPPVPLANSTLRQFVRTSIGGKNLRVRFCNIFGTDAVTIHTAHLALAADKGSAGSGEINPATDKALTFNGAAEVLIPKGESVFSDPVKFDFPALADVAVSTYFGDISATTVTGHPGSRATSFIVVSNAVSAASLPDAKKTAHWYLIAGIEVQADSSGKTIVILGDSITDGRGSTTDGNNRWPDVLAQRLITNAPTAKVGVVNMGIGGNAIFGGLGPAAIKRFDRDVLEQPGVRYFILFEGVNDIGGRNSSMTTVTNLVTAYAEMASKAKARGIRAYAATITPFGGNGYYSDLHEQERQYVNEWIRTNTVFDGVIDFDAAARDPVTLTNFQAVFHPGLNANDWLHLNPAGYKALGDAIDLNLFAP